MRRKIVKRKKKRGKPAKALKRKVVKSRKKRRERVNPLKGKAVKSRKRRGRIDRLLAMAEEGWRPRAGGWYKPPKKLIRLRLDKDVLDWFKATGPGYQTRINRALWQVMREEKAGSGK